VSSLPFENHLVKGAPLGLGPRVPAVKLAMSGSLIEQVEPPFRIIGRHSLFVVSPFPRDQPKDVGLRAPKRFNEFGGQRARSYDA
jgi:hypothetical protein